MKANVVSKPKYTEPPKGGDIILWQGRAAIVVALEFLRWTDKKLAARTSFAV